MGSIALSWGGALLRRLARAGKEKTQENLTPPSRLIGRRVKDRHVHSES